MYFVYVEEIKFKVQLVNLVNDTFIYSVTEK